MEKYYEALLDRLDELHRSVMETLDQLPAEAIDWVPAPEMNSLAVLVAHFCGAERYYIGDVVMGQLSFRDRSAEFNVKGLDAVALKHRVEDLSTFERKAFERLRLAHLDEDRIAPKDGRKFSVAWALNHALEHTAVHVGHIQILKQMWDLKAQASSKSAAKAAAPAD